MAKQQSKVLDQLAEVSGLKRNPKESDRPYLSRMILAIDKAPNVDDLWAKLPKLAQTWFNEALPCAVQERPLPALPDDPPSEQAGAGEASTPDAVEQEAGGDAAEAHATAGATELRPTQEDQVSTKKARKGKAKGATSKKIRRAAEPKAAKKAAGGMDRTKDKAPKAATKAAATGAKAKNGSGGVIRGINLAPAAEVKSCRAGSKQAIMVDLLSRPEGVTFAELKKALSGGKPWVDATVRSGLNWDMNRVKGYGIRTELVEGGEARLHLVLPKGVRKPPAHTPKAGAAA